MLFLQSKTNVEITQISSKNTKKAKDTQLLLYQLKPVGCLCRLTRGAAILLVIVVGAQASLHREMTVTVLIHAI